MHLRKIFPALIKIAHGGNIELKQGYGVDGSVGAKKRASFTAQGVATFGGVSAVYLLLR